MANRYPLILDTTDNNKIKEIQFGDNLNLADNSIVGVQNITALGTIDAADIKVNGNRLVAQSFADLTDTPSTFVGSPNYFVKVKADGTGLEFRPLSDLGNIEIDNITVDTGIIPSVDGVGYLGTEAAKFNEIVAATLKGNLVSFNEEIVFNATTGKISYAALQGAPQFLSEFTNDVGYLRTVDLDEQLAGLFDEGQQFVTDIQGSVFGDDSTVLVDAVNSIITGDVLNTSIDTASLTASQVTTTVVTAQLFEGPNAGDMQIDAGTSGIINIGTSVSTTAVNIEKATLDTFDQGTGLGIAQITADTDLAITAGNRVRIEGGVPFRFASVNASEQLAIGAQEGDVIYNTTSNRLQMYQGGTWKDVNGNVEATTGTSNFNDVVVAGNLTVSGTTTTVDTANTTIKDNVITLNEGESGAGVTAGTSGIEIDRGSEANKTFVWDDSVDKWTLGSEALVTGQIETIGMYASVISSKDLGPILQITAGEVGGTGQTILINPQGSDTTVQTIAETHTWRTGPLTGFSSSPYIDFKTAGAFETHNGAYFDGNLVGDVKGSVFGDDSTILVDSVNGVIPAANLTGTATITVIGNVTGNLTGNADTVTNGVYTTGDQTIAGVKTFSSAILSDVQGDLTGDVTGNIDNATLTVGATTATTIAIGNSGSTTTINGDLALGIGALIVGEITADDSISITTAIGDGNAISIGPQGTNRVINLTADSIRFFGPITQNINAQAGITGDIKGSVVADDSTVMIDGQSGTIVGPIVSANVSGTLVKATTIENNTTNDLAVNAAGFININAGTSAAGLSKIQMDQAGINYIELTTEPVNPANPADVANISINATTSAGDVVIGAIGSTRNQIVTIHNATVNGSLVGNVTGTVIGTVEGDVQGSVFADDSSLMVDAVNYAMFSDTLSLTPLNAPPANPINGMIAVADGTGWDPASNAKNTLVAYLGGAWVTVAAAA